MAKHSSIQPNHQCHVHVQDDHDAKVFHLVEWSVIVSRLSLIFSPLYKAVVNRRHLPSTSSPMPQRVSPRCQACRQTSAPLRRPRTHNCPGVVGITWRLRMTTGRLKRTAPEKGFRIDIISMKWNLIYQDDLILIWFNMHYMTSFWPLGIHGCKRTSLNHFESTLTCCAYGSIEPQGSSWFPTGPGPLFPHPVNWRIHNLGLRLLLSKSHGKKKASTIYWNILELLH